MSDELADAVETFLDDVDGALREYDRGYVDADATLAVVRDHLEELEDATE